METLNVSSRVMKYDPGNKHNHFGTTQETKTKMSLHLSILLDAV